MDIVFTHPVLGGNGQSVRPLSHALQGETPHRRQAWSAADKGLFAFRVPQSGLANEPEWAALKKHTV